VISSIVLFTIDNIQESLEVWCIVFERYKNKREYGFYFEEKKEILKKKYV
jgi:hypothetical protein